jgi:hypothetical protein
MVARNIEVFGDARQACREGLVLAHSWAGAVDPALQVRLRPTPRDRQTQASFVSIYE